MASQARCPACPVLSYDNQSKHSREIALTLALCTASLVSRARADGVRYPNAGHLSPASLKKFAWYTEELNSVILGFVQTNFTTSLFRKRQVQVVCRVLLFFSLSLYFFVVFFCCFCVQRHMKVHKMRYSTTYSKITVQTVVCNQRSSQS